MMYYDGNAKFLFEAEPSEPVQMLLDAAKNIGKEPSALERVIAEQQKEIDRMKKAIDQSNEQWQKNYRSRERMAYAAFGLIHEPTSHEAMWALKMELQAQGWCVLCESSPCECDHD